MKIAIVHDYIKEYGGAERVLEELIKIYPKATVYTTVYLPKFLGPHEERFSEYKIRTSFLQYLPFKAKLISPFRLFSLLAFKFFNFSGFDLIIVSQTGAYFPNVIDKEKAKLVCYTHTPPRYLYGYKTARNFRKNLLMRAVIGLLFHVLRQVDYLTSKNVDYFIANSNEVKARIKKFYKRDAVVIYPPVDTKLGARIKASEKTNWSYYLCGGRLARAKGTDVIVRAFAKNGKRLKIFGKGFAGFDRELKGFATNNIEFLGEVGDAEKFKLMRGAKAFIFASYDEDFGITPVEAQSVGTPVIAYRSGGVIETVVDPSASMGKATGIFFDENKAGALNQAIERFEKMQFDKSVIIKHASKFSKEKFDRQIEKFISKVTK